MVAPVPQLTFGIHVVPGLVVDRNPHFGRIAVVHVIRAFVVLAHARVSADSTRTDSGRTGSSPGCCTCRPIADRTLLGPERVPCFRLIGKPTAQTSAARMRRTMKFPPSRRKQNLATALSRSLQRDPSPRGRSGSFDRNAV